MATTAADGPHTPGALGYAIAVAVSVVTFSALLLAPVVRESVAGFVLGVFLGTAVGLMYAIPVAAIGISIVHVFLRRVPAQTVHVLAFGLLGFAIGAGFGVISDRPVHLGTLGFGALLATATAAGRAAVIPVVLRRRQANARASTSASLPSA